jgi:hypothetical protein
MRASDEKKIDKRLENVQSALDLYLDTGRSPGNFLQAVLANDLERAVSAATRMDMLCLKDIVWMARQYRKDAEELLYDSTIEDVKLIVRDMNLGGD